jgi:hypothetical protein
MALETATNPNTGERVALVNGQWQPIAQTATNKEGKKAYLVGEQWLTDESSLPEVTVTPDSMTVSEVPGPRKYSWAEVPGAAISNISGSFARQVEGLATAVSSPIDTTRDLLRLIGGAGLKALPESVQKTIVSNSYDPASVQQAIDSAGAVGDFYKQRYGTADGFKRAVAEDPVGVLADFSTLVGGAAGLAGKAGMAKTATGLGAVSAYTNPLTPVVKAAAVPVKAAAQGVGYVRNVLAPKEAGLLAAAEGQGQEIVNALRNYDQYVASGMPTAGAVVAGELTAPRYAALQQQVSQLKPREYMEREAANVAARGKALGTVAQDEAAIKAAETARTQATKPLYGAADKQIIKADDTLNDLLDRPSMEKAMARAKTLAKERNETFQMGKNVPEQKVGSAIVDVDGKPLDTKTIPAEYAKFNGKSLHYLKLALDDLIKDPVTFGLGSNEVAAISKTRGEFLNWFEGKSANYAAAREAYQQASKPINIMQVGQYLEGKLKPALETSIGERAGVFAGAVKEAPTTIKRATGQTRFEKLGDILEPDQVKVVEGIRKDLAREAEFTKQAREGGKAGEVFPATEAARLPNLMSRVASVANTIITKLQGKIDKKLALELATEMLDPKLAAAAMEKALQRQAKGEKLAEPFKIVGRAAFEAGRSPLTLGGVQVTNALAAESQNNLGK